MFPNTWHKYRASMESRQSALYCLMTLRELGMKTVVQYLRIIFCFSIFVLFLPTTVCECLHCVWMDGSRSGLAFSSSLVLEGELNSQISMNRSCGVKMCTCSIHVIIAGNVSQFPLALPSTHVGIHKKLSHE